MLKKIYIFKFVFVFLLTFTFFYFSGSNVLAINCPANLTPQCAPAVTYTKNILTSTQSQTSPTSQCFQYDALGNLRNDTYVSHNYYNCRNASVRNSDGGFDTVCDFSVVCSINPVCTCVGPASTACTQPVSFANKDLEVRESSAASGYATELYRFNVDNLKYGDVDLRTGAAENYDIYRSNMDGTQSATGAYISILMARNYIGDGPGNNIDSAVLVDRLTGSRYPATAVVSKLVGSSEPAWADDQSYNALGEPDSKWTAVGDQVSRITLGYSYESCQSTPSPVPATASPVPSVAPSAQCSMTKIYTNGWVELTPEAFKGLTQGIQVYFCVNGVTNTNVFDSGRFTINGVTRTQTTVKRPNTNDFCDLYTIPANTYTFKVQGELHHATLGWL